MIVLDASVLANAVGDDGPDGPDGAAARAVRAARAVIAAETVIAVPDLANIETVAVLRKRWIARTLDDERFTAAVEDYAAFGFVRYPTLGLLGRIAELRANVTAYNATYIALAEALDCALVTGDARLSRASGPRCPIRTLTT